MSSRDDILGRVKRNQPEHCELPPLAYAPVSAGEPIPSGDPVSAGEPEVLFIATLEAIGGIAYRVSGFDRIATMVRELWPEAHRIVTGIPQLKGIGEKAVAGADPHTLEDTDLAILPAHFGVAENGACWITEAQMVQRVLPFIAQHLALVVPARAIVADMHAAYQRIALLDADAPYGFATFIAGPSKTADIEQSLVLGAHGPASLTVFLLDERL